MRAALFKEMSKPLVIETVRRSHARPERSDPEGEKLRHLRLRSAHDRTHHRMMPLALGSIMGHEFAGEVVEVGKNVNPSLESGRPRRRAFPTSAAANIRRA